MSTSNISNLNQIPQANRLHIGFFGKRNSGKSSLINALTGQKVSIVSDVAGTTTDAVSKSMEIHGIGPCVLIDTAGFDDDAGELGQQRVEKTRLAAEKTEIAVIVFNRACVTASEKHEDEKVDITQEIEWIKYFKSRKVPVLAVVTHADEATKQNVEAESIAEAAKNANFIKEELGLTPINISSVTGEGIDEVRKQLVRLVPEDFGIDSITGDLVKDGDTVVLVMPQDIQAPKGRLILPQVQTIRDLLDKKCIVVGTTVDKLEQALNSLKEPPTLVITDSQVFPIVEKQCPKKSRLTSFSVLFAAYKGDIKYYLDGAKVIDALTTQSKVLIAECCTHVPKEEDIGRVKIPHLLRKRVGEGLQVDVVSGAEFPADLSQYDLIIQCGGCMFNRKYIMARIDHAREQRIPMTNYGVAIAHLTGIIDKILIT